jgi:hypothetical protein
MAEQEALAGGIWLRILSSLIITLIVATLIYAAVIGLSNFQRIGV